MNSINDSGMAAVSFDHGGHIVPYFFKEASTDAQDWNLPDDCIGYKIDEIGFDIPNMFMS